MPFLAGAAPGRPRCQGSVVFAFIGAHRESLDRKSGRLSAVFGRKGRNRVRLRRTRPSSCIHAMRPNCRWSWGTTESWSSSVQYPSESESSWCLYVLASAWAWFPLNRVPAF